MNTTTKATILTLAAIAGTATIHTATAAADTTGTCVVTAQPQNLTSYHLAYTDRDGSMHTLIAHQDGRRLDPTDFEIPDDFDTVLWASKHGRIDGPDSFYDHLENAGGCTFTEPYHAAPGWRPSIVIRVGAPAPTTTTAPTTTSTTAATTTTIDRQASPTTVTWIDQMPPATVTPMPQPPGIDTPSTSPVTDVELTDDPTPYTAVPTTPALPVTGSNSLQLLWAGGAALALGVITLGLSRCRRQNGATHKERNFDAS